MSGIEENSVIPRTLYLFWAGGKISWMRYMTIKSFKELNSDWSIAIYTTRKHNAQFYKRWKRRQDYETYKGEDYTEKFLEMLHIWEPSFDVDHLTPIHQSDVFRWWILYTRGGFYSDFDILYVNRMNLNVDCTYLFCGANSKLAIGFLGAQKETTFYKEVLNIAIKGANNADYQSAGVRAVNAALVGLEASVVPEQLNKWKLDWFEILESKYEGNKIKIPDNIIYPWGWENVDEIFLRLNNVPRETIGIHWYGATELAQKFNCILNERNAVTVSNTFCKYARNYINERT